MTASQVMKKISKRLPGILSPPPKTEIDGKITDLSLKTVRELLELRDRQVKLLTNKPFISKLPDKGAKIQAFHDKIINELKSKQEDQACSLLDNLKLNSIDKESVQDVEWDGKIVNKNNVYLDSDDDSEPEDVLEILSQNTAQEKKIKVILPETPLVTPEDLIKLGEIPHVQYIVDKTEVNSKPNAIGLYKPFKTTRSDVHDPSKEIHRKKHKHWEVTAATPPPSIHGPAKLLNLGESLKLQKEYNMHLKEIEVQHAAEKLLAKSGVKMADLSEMTSFGKYRETNSDESEVSDPEGSEEEVHDEEPERGGVVYSIMK